MNYIRKKAEKLRTEILTRQMMVRRELGTHCESLIVPIEMPSNEHALYVQKGLMAQGYLIGAIRQPTVEKPIVRVILNLNVSIKKLRHALALIRHNLVQ